LRPPPNSDRIDFILLNEKKSYRNPKWDSVLFTFHRGGGVEEVHRVIRRKGDRYDDFRMFPNDIEGKVVFLGGKDYLPLFFKLTENGKAKRIEFFNYANAPRLENCELKRFETTTRTNWHYECAKALFGGKISL
jgi:hypothetical protein